MSPQPNPNDQDSAAALRSAISEGDVETVLNLLDRGADVNARIVIDARYGDETAPLQYAVSEGQLEIVELLLNRGADVDSHAGGRTPLQNAVYSGHRNREIIHALLDFGADTESDPEESGETPLYLALTDGGRGEVVLALLEGGAEITDSVMNYLSERSSDLYEALVAGMDYEEYLDIELRGRRIEYSDSYMETEGVGDFSLVAYFRTALIDSGASSDLNARDESGASPLHRAASAGQTELVVAWLSIDAMIDARDRDYRTPLHWAAAEGCTETAVALLQSGANPDVRDKEGYTPLTLAIHAGNDETVAALLQSGANAEWRDAKGATLLHVAAEFEDGGTAEILLDRGADISARNNDGLTPLHWSMIRGRSATAQLLIERGADIFAEDDDGKTPLDYAFEFEYVDEEAEPDFEDNG